jgi:hypothetical protein
MFHNAGSFSSGTSFGHSMVPSTPNRPIGRARPGLRIVGGKLERLINEIRLSPTGEERLCHRRPHDACRLTAEPPPNTACSAYGAPAGSLLDDTPLLCIAKLILIILLYLDQTRPTSFALGRDATATMRLLKHSLGGDFELVTFNDDDPPPYAILSHTWTEGQEVTYDELKTGTGKHKTGYDKIRFCGKRAAVDGLEYFWVDTCCIHRLNPDGVELSMAINSMFRWYQRAVKCYVYLSDVHVPNEVVDAQACRIMWVEAFRQSRWFTRGWTLQELLAPASVEFFSEEGKCLGNKKSLEQELHHITKIPTRVLGGTSLTEVSVEERMSWAAKRTTTWKEDKVYCLLGIFRVFLPLIYGEGEEYAMSRLKDEIQRRQEGRAIENLHDSPSVSQF